jgi:nicotinamide mononucleotide adenylyltransferase
MIYDPEQPKFRSYCRKLTAAERVSAVYAREMQKAEMNREREMKREEKRWYSNWETSKAAVYMDMVDARKNIEFKNWKKRQTTDPGRWLKHLADCSEPR